MPPTIPIARSPAPAVWSAPEHAALRRLAALMIPASARHGVPGADDAAIFDDILGTIAPQAERVRAMLRSLDELAGGQAFASLDAARQADVAQALRQQRSSGLAALVGAVVQCYYRDDRVMRSLDMEARPPFPKGFEVEQGDWSLLDPVRGRAPMYRDDR